ncbi:hypothetical protein E1742_16690 [Pseudoduganella plicata]|nr:hypothetical protein E1742_16690 [Pseudoduganella plicata]
MLALLILCMGSATAQPQERGWVSYRDAYRAMVTFAKYGKAKNLLQDHYQVSPKDGQSAEGLRLTLSGRTTQLDLPLDPTGRITLPLLKAAYDENAVLVLNRKVSGFSFQPRLSIVARVDGIYEGQELRIACDQALQYLRSTDAGYQSRHCAGVRFAFPKRSDATVRVRDAEREVALAPEEGAVFDGDTTTDFRVMVYRFASWPERGQVISQNAPLAIVPVIE